MIKTFYDQPIPKSMSLGEFIKAYPDLVPLAERDINAFFKVDGGFCPFLKTKKIGEKLYLFSLLPKQSVPSILTQIIPDNDFNFIADLNLNASSLKTSKVKVSLGHSSTIELSFDVMVHEYSISNLKTISFPEDYFIKGYEILTEKIANSNVYLLDKTKKGHNSNYSSIRGLWLNQLSKAS